MDWYCLVFNSGEINGAGSAQYLYEKICEGDFSLVGDIDIIDNLYNELINEVNKRNLENKNKIQENYENQLKKK